MALLCFLCFLKERIDHYGSFIRPDHDSDALTIGP